MHEERCDHCDLLNTFPLRIEELFQELLEAPGTSNISLEGEVEEWRYDLENAIEDITYYKRTVMRSKVSEEYWDKQFEKKDPETVLVTSDFAMKLIPRKSRETSDEFFGKKGMSWHIISFERVVKEEEKFVNKTEVFIQLIQGPNNTGETKQDSDAVVSLILSALRKYKRYNPDVKKAVLKAGMHISMKVGSCLAVLILLEGTPSLQKVYF